MIDETIMSAMFGAVTRLQVFDECEAEVLTLKEKLQDMWAQVPEKDGLKSCSNYHFYSNGLMERIGESETATILEPWESTTTAPEPEVRLNNRNVEVFLEQFRNHSLVWYYQLAHRLGKRFVVYYSNGSPLKALEKLARYEALTKEQQAMLSGGSLKKKVAYTGYELYEFLEDCSHSRDSQETKTWFFLSPTELDSAIATIKLLQENPNYNGYTAVREFINILGEGVSVDRQVFTLPDMTITREERYYGQYRYTKGASEYPDDYIQFIKDTKATLDKIENEEHRYIIYRLGMGPQPKRKRKAKVAPATTEEVA